MSGAVAEWSVPLAVRLEPREPVAAGGDEDAIEQPWLGPSADDADLAGD